MILNRERGECKQNRLNSFHGAGLMQVAGLPDIKRKKQPDKVDENSSQGSSQGSSQARTE